MTAGRWASVPISGPYDAGEVSGGPGGEGCDWLQTFLFPDVVHHELQEGPDPAVVVLGKLDHQVKDDADLEGAQLLPLRRIN